MMIENERIELNEIVNVLVAELEREKNVKENVVKVRSMREEVELKMGNSKLN